MSLSLLWLCWFSLTCKAVLGAGRSGFFLITHFTLPSGQHMAQQEHGSQNLGLVHHRRGALEQITSWVLNYCLQRQLGDECLLGLARKKVKAA